MHFFGIIWKKKRGQTEKKIETICGIGPIELKTKENKIKLAINPSVEYNSYCSRKAVCHGRSVPPETMDAEGAGRRRLVSKQADSSGDRPGTRLEMLPYDRSAVVLRRSVSVSLCILPPRENLSHKGEIMHGNYR